MKVATLIASRNRPDLVDSLVVQLRARTTVENDLYVVECGTDPAKLSEHSTLWYADEPFRGKCYGHNLALQAALLAGEYDYVFVLMNDLVFPEDVDPVATLVGQMEAEPRLACLSPTERGSHYPAGRPQPGGGWRTVTTSDYLALMLRVEAIRDGGFLNPGFTYCWGAIHELSYRLYSRGWKLGYSDAVSYRHLGGSTYGAADTNTISRDEYQVQAREFAARYFRETYGDRWDELFWDAAQWAEPEANTYALHRRLWEGGPVPVAAEPKPLVFRRPTELGAPPDFVGVGAMKASTTRWFALLGAHPGVHCPDRWRKELHFFDDRPDGFDPGEYHALFARPQGLLSGEWTPSYMFLEHVPPLLAKAAPNAKLIAILRDPVERYRSGITHSAQRWGMLNDGWLRMHREIGFYARQLRRLYDWFPHEQVLVLQHERCAVDPRGQLARTFRFLGLDPAFVPAEVDEVIHGTEVEKFHLPESSRRALVEAYADDVADLSRLVPDLDLALWSSFARPQAAAVYEQAGAGSARSAVRLHLGSGRRPREGWVNVDADPAVEPDLVARAESLTTVADATVEAVEGCHLFEHFTYPEARAALREWHRVLRPGGTLELELPNLDACVHMLGRNVDAGGYDFGMIGIYGYPPAIADAGAFQAHKWGWTPETLGAALIDAGFTDVQEVPIEQTWRPAAAFGRDMRMRARRPG